MFKLDENLCLFIAEYLRIRGFDIHTVVDENLQGTDDHTLIQKASRESRALITLDLDFANIRNYPPTNFFGMIVFRPASFSPKNLDAILENLQLLASKESFKGKLVIFDEAKARI